MLIGGVIGAILGASIAIVVLGYRRRRKLAPIVRADPVATRKTVRCSCGFLTRVPRSYVGRTLKCVECGARFKVGKPSGRVA